MNYFKTHHGALQEVENYVKLKGYKIMHPDNLWVNHLYPGDSTKYNFALMVIKTENLAKKWVHIQIYRMSSGSYELNYYLN
tara:strand:- start:420 stop:662 length:243 start_codon:yes stop_codon:yes gene_type:complete